MIRHTTTTIGPALLLGPQRLQPILKQAFDTLEIEGTIAVITAGWQEREAEDHELVEALGRPGINLRLHARADDIFQKDPELFDANRAKQDRLKRLQGIYRRRLTHTLAAARQMHESHESAAPAERDLFDTHLASAIAAVRALDDEHAHLTRAEWKQFTEQLQPAQRTDVVRHRAELQAILDRCNGVAIAGGHVVALLNRLRLFGLETMLADKSIVAWSAGAMALTERIVLFHDSPPQGRGDAEVLGDGLAVVPGVVALPRARRRLLLDDRKRIGLFARRFAPARCVTLDELSWLRPMGDGTWQAGPETFTLSQSGERIAMAPNSEPDGSEPDSSEIH